MKISVISTFAGVVAVMFLTGCACTRIRQVSGHEFLERAKQCNVTGNVEKVTFTGITMENAYLRYEYPASIGNGKIITLYWTPLSELPRHRLAELKSEELSTPN